MRKALVVGIDYYKDSPRLFGCVRDARAIAKMLEMNGDGSPNFDTRKFLGSSSRSHVTRLALKEMIRELFIGDIAETALFYFAGHSSAEPTGGYLRTSECKRGDDGVSLAELLAFANQSKAENRVIILDCSFSGMAGSVAGEPALSQLSEGVAILTASTAGQYACEMNGAGIMTSLLVNALEGAAANVAGEVSVASAYAHVEQCLGSWEQRPLFKANVRGFISLRTVVPVVEKEELRQLIRLFPSPNNELRLDPSFESTSERPNRRKVGLFAMLEKYCRANLVVPVGAPQLYEAAMSGKSCRLTPLGRHYWRLVKVRRI